MHDHGTNPLFDLLANRCPDRSDEFHDFVHWLIRGQERFLVDPSANDNEGRSIMNYIVEALHRMRTVNEDSPMARMYVQSFRAMIREGANINAKDVYGKSLLHTACKKRQIDIVCMLLEHGCNIETRDLNNCTALHHVVYDNDCEMVSILVEHGADVEAIAKSCGQLPALFRHSSFATPLSLVAISGSMKMFHIIWKAIARTHGCQNREDEQYLAHILSIAADCGNLDVVRLLASKISSKALLSAVVVNKFDPVMIEALIDAGASPNGLADYPDARVDLYTPTRHPPLAIAARENCVDAVAKLLELGANPDYRMLSGWPENIGYTALHYAAVSGDEEVVDLLLSFGANHEARSTGGQTPADLAMSSGYTELALKLYTNHDTKAVSHLTSGPAETPHYSLFGAFRLHDIDVVKRMFATAASPDNNSLNMDRALHVAIISGSFGIAEYLIHSGASVHTHCWRFIDGIAKYEAPLLDAAAKCNSRLMHLLISKGANVNQVLNENDTALLRVLDRCWVDDRIDPESRAHAVHTLLEAGALVNVKDDLGRTPLGKAAQLGAVRAARLLIAAGANLDDISTVNTRARPYMTDARHVSPSTPLAWAAYHGHEDMVKLLYEAGAQWKSLKKDPALVHIHSLLMQSWFIDLVPSEKQNMVELPSNTGTSCHNLPGSNKLKPNTETSTETNPSTQQPSSPYAWFLQWILPTRCHLRGAMNKMSTQPLKTVQAAIIRIRLELVVAMAVAVLLLLQHIRGRIIRYLQR